MNLNTVYDSQRSASFISHFFPRCLARILSTIASGEKELSEFQSDLITGTFLRIRLAVQCNYFSDYRAVRTLSLRGSAEILKHIFNRSSPSSEVREGRRKSLLKWTSPHRYTSLTSIWILGTIPFSSRRSGQATMETNGRTLTGGSNLEVFPGQPRARPVRGVRESTMTLRWARSVRPARGQENACEKVS